jgi:hypothetical protein
MNMAIDFRFRQRQIFHVHLSNYGISRETVGNVVGNWGLTEMDLSNSPTPNFVVLTQQIVPATRSRAERKGKLTSTADISLEVRQPATCVRKQTEQERNVPTRRHAEHLNGKGIRLYVLLSQWSAIPWRRENSSYLHSWFSDSERTRYKIRQRYSLFLTPHPDRLQKILLDSTRS